MDDRPDEALVAGVREGDATAFDALVARYQDRVYRLAHRLTGNAADAEEALQDAFLQVHRHLDAFRGDARFSTWLYRIATNAALMLARKRRPVESLDGEEGEGLLRLVSTPPRDTVEEELDRRALVERVHTALDGLPEMYRAALVLRDLEELSSAEAAEILGIETAALRQRVHRARLLLREGLRPLAPPPAPPEAARPHPEGVR
jgi:RNA polymerase sigma-70 factor (ECF subfamily)